eukprot:gene5595-11281_t
MSSFDYDPSSSHAIVSFPLEQRRGYKLDSRTQRRLAEASHLHHTELAPLYQGFGVHYSYIWVGTPPQRVSVIVDTGSHHTAFPCTGCKCGKHYDPYWDPKKSSTSKILKCNGNNQCQFSQSYTEGSSWKAFKVRDKIWMGGIGKDMITDADKWTFDFTFGCQSSETGLFRTQQVDGIMGMSASDDTFPFQLYRNNITATRAFAMCFKVGGGIITLGGVNEYIHRSPMQYALSLKPMGWYTIRLLEVLMREPISNTTNRLDVPMARYNEGKGTIVDSGTTDTYMPSSIRNAFVTLFRKISGVPYSNALIKLSPLQYSKLPDLIFRIEGLSGNPPIEITMSAKSYAEKHKMDKYTFRIYLSEQRGVVLGANFMNGKNVLFDSDLKRIGFADSECTYGDVDPGKRRVQQHLKAEIENEKKRKISVSSTSITSPLSSSSSSTSSRDHGCVDGKQLRAISVCTARCEAPTLSSITTTTSTSTTGTETATVTSLKGGKSGDKNPSATAPTGEGYIAYGEQQMSSMKCSHDSNANINHNITLFRRPCNISCTGDHLIVSHWQCHNTPWTECNGQCTQERTESRVCQIHRCPLGTGDHVLSLELRLRRLDLGLWSEDRKEDVLAAVAKLFMVPDGAVRLPSTPVGKSGTGSGTGSGKGKFLKLHLRIRIRQPDIEHMPATALNDRSAGSVSVHGGTKADVRVEALVAHITANSGGYASMKLVSLLTGRGGDDHSGSSGNNNNFNNNNSNKLSNGVDIKFTAVSDWSWLQSDDIQISSASITSVQGPTGVDVGDDGSSSGGGGGFTSIASSHHSEEGGSPQSKQKLQHQLQLSFYENNSKWAMLGTLGILVSAFSLFCCLYRRQAPREVRIGSKREVVQIYRDRRV